MKLILILCRTFYLEISLFSRSCIKKYEINEREDEWHFIATSGIPASINFKKVHENTIQIQGKCTFRKWKCTNYWYLLEIHHNTHFSYLINGDHSREFRYFTLVFRSLFTDLYSKFKSTCLVHPFSVCLFQDFYALEGNVHSRALGVTSPFPNGLVLKVGSVIDD